MPPRQRIYKMGDPYNRYEAMEWASCHSDLDDLWQDLGDLENYLTRKLHLFERLHPNQRHVIKYLNKFQVRVRAYRQDLFLIRKAYRDGVDHFEHIGGPIRFNKVSRVLEYGLPVSPTTDEIGDGDMALEKIYG